MPPGDAIGAATLRLFCDGGEAMAKVICLGWGSLIWSPRTLPLASRWFEGGPAARVEFLRESPGGRLTLVLDPTGSRVRLRWALVKARQVEEAWEALRVREGVPGHRPEWVGIWRPGDAVPGRLPALDRWARRRHADAVIWTALPARFEGVEGRIPSLREALAYLRSRQGAEATAAREYVERAPAQTDTWFRRRFELEFGWGRR
jgi:cation transport regulator ChaC